MRSTTINNSRHPLYEAISALYARSFPIFEQRTSDQQAYAFAHSQYRLIAYSDQGELIGFISYWEFEDYLYIEHFAINTDIRGRGYGSQLLSTFVQSADRRILLEIDPIVDEVSRARQRFYQRCGFHTNPYPHRHPPYRCSYPAHSLIVLTTEQVITEAEYQRFAQDLAQIVMLQP